MSFEELLGNKRFGYWAFLKYVLQSFVFFLIHLKSLYTIVEDISWIVQAWLPTSILPPHFPIQNKQLLW